MTFHVDYSRVPVPYMVDGVREYIARGLTPTPETNTNRVTA